MMASYPKISNRKRRNANGVADDVLPTRRDDLRDFARISRFILLFFSCFVFADQRSTNRTMILDVSLAALRVRVCS